MSQFVSYFNVKWTNEMQIEMFILSVELYFEMTTVLMALFLSIDFYGQPIKWLHLFRIRSVGIGSAFVSM